MKFQIFAAWPGRKRRRQRRGRRRLGERKQGEEPLDHRLVPLDLQIPGAQGFGELAATVDQGGQGVGVRL